MASKSIANDQSCIGCSEQPMSHARDRAVAGLACRGDWEAYLVEAWRPQTQKEHILIKLLADVCDRLHRAVKELESRRREQSQPQQGGPCA